LHVYIAGVALAAIALYAWSFQIWRPRWAIESMVLPSVFGIIIALAYKYPLHVSPKLKVGLSSAPLFAAFLLFDPPITISVAVAGAVLADVVFSRRPWYEVLFDLAQTVIYVSLAGFVYRRLSPSPTPFAIEDWQQLVAILAAGVTMYLGNTLLVATAMGLQLGTNPLAMWRANWRYDMAEYAALLLLGILTALTVSVYPWSIVLTTLPMAIVYMSLKNSLQLRFQAKERENMARELSALTEVGEALNRALTLEETLDIVLRKAMSLVGREEGSIILLDPRTNTMRIAANYGLLPEVVEAFNSRPVYAYEGTFGIVLKTGEMLEIPDALHDPRVLHEAGKVPEQLINVPLRTEEGVIGVIALDALPLDDRARRLLMALGDLAAVAIQRARLFEEEKRRAAQLALINEIGEKAASILDMDRLMQEVTRSIQESFNYYNVSLFLLDEERGEVVLQAVAGGFEHLISGEYRQSLDKGIVGFVARTGNSWLTNNVSKDPYYIKGAPGEVLTKSELCVPIKLGDRVIGALDVQSVRLNDFDQEDLVAMEAVADRLAIGIHNARLYKEMAGLYDVGLVVSSTLELDKTLRAIYEQLNRLMSFDTFYVALYDEARGELRFEIFVEEGEWLPKFAKKLDGGGLTAWIIRSRKPLFIGDLEEERESLPTVPGLMGKPGVRSWMGLPLIAKDNVVGVISVQSFRPHAFAEADKRLLSAFANQAAIAIENARLYEETRCRLQELDMLYRASMGIIGTLELDETLQLIMDSAVKAVPHAQKGSLHLLDEDGKRLVMRAGCGFSREVMEAATFEVGEGYTGWAFAHNQPVIIDNVKTDPRTKPIDLPEVEEEKSAICVPLVVKGKAIGTITLDNIISYGAFNEDDLRLLSAFAAQAAIAIENARLYEAAQQELAERRRAEEELRQSYLKLRRALEGTIRTLVSAIEMRDPHTAGHQQGVARLACAIAQEMGLSQEQIEGIRMAALIHDVGKISVPAEILNKPGSLSDLEYGLIQTHPQVGHAILNEAMEFPWPVAQIVLQHHERMDGSGYPQGLSGEEIILEARILAVADVVEAMASHRPYRPPHGLDKALEEISQNRGILYDPEVVDACLRLFKERGFKFE